MARDPKPRPVDELLKHEPMLRFFDDLVVGVAKFRRAVRQVGRKLQKPALEHALELEPHLHGAGDEVQADARPHGGRLRAIPLRLGQGAVLPKLPARIIRVDLIGRVVPRDVGVGIEVLGDRLATEPRNKSFVFFR